MQNHQQIFLWKLLNDNRYEFKYRQFISSFISLHQYRLMGVPPKYENLIKRTKQELKSIKKIAVCMNRWHDEWYDMDSKGPNNGRHFTPQIKQEKLMHFICIVHISFLSYLAFYVDLCLYIIYHWSLTDGEDPFAPWNMIEPTSRCTTPHYKWRCKKKDLRQYHSNSEVFLTKDFCTEWRYR